MTDKNRQNGNESVGEKSDDLALAVAVRERAKAFAREHCRVLAQEIVEWQDTAVLANGRLRELATIWAEIDGAYSLNLAEKSSIREALEIAARPAPEALGAAKGVTDEIAMRVALAIIANLEDRRGVLDDVDDEIKQEIAEEIAMTIKAKTFPSAKDQS